jgi:phytoene desaturase
MKSGPVKRVAIIGAGIAGLATAVRLAAKGMEVEVFEKNAYPGGKLSHFAYEGYQFDAGPSLFTQAAQVDELFRICGLHPEDHFSYCRSDEACRYFFESGKKLTAYADRHRLASEMAQQLGENEQDVLRYMNSSETAFNHIGTLFLTKSLHQFSSFSIREIWDAIRATKTRYLFSSLHSYNENLLKTKEAVQIFNRYATYNGSNPFTAPAMLSMIPHLEINEGTFYPAGGMISITRSIHQLGERMGVKFHFNAPVDSILTEGKKMKGLLVHNEKIHFDAIVSNMDVYYTYGKLLGNPVRAQKVLKQERSSSAVIFYWAINTSFPQLGLHNIFFTEDYKTEFNHIFDRSDLYHDPTVYINITSKMEPNQAPEGAENWFVMVNAPHDKGQDWETLRRQARQHVLAKLTRMLGKNPEPHIVFEDYLDPPLIDRKTNSYTGSLYGTSSNSKFAAFLRHPNFSTSYQGLYFVGGSVHPGGGIPLCLRSAEIVSNLL